MNAAPLAVSRVLPRGLRFRFAYLVILAVAVLFAVSFGRKMWENRQLRGEVVAERAQTAAIVQSNQQLRREIRDDRSLAFVYQQARQWGYVKQGDRPVIISFHYAQRRARPISTPVVRPHAASWLQWWEAFFGH
ncbi:MAG TPA: septum formation initiator family protein [Chloroflexota bacterium]|nr:septum formation initiator family protein [Chloroflexota bacterium]